MAVEQVKADNTTENVLNEILQNIRFLYRAKGITKKLFNNIINSIQIQYKMDTIFMNLKNVKLLILIDY